MGRFNDAQVGDLVYCRVNGDGVVTELRKPYQTFKLTVNGLKLYTESGKLHPETSEPTLFYRLGTCRYLTARPANGSKQAFRDCRTCLGLDRVAMAAALGVSRHTVRNWETDKHPNNPPDWAWKSIERMTPNEL